MLKQKYFLTGIFILSAERQPIKLSWRKIVWLQELLFYFGEIAYNVNLSFCNILQVYMKYKSTFYLIKNVIYDDFYFL